MLGRRIRRIVLLVLPTLALLAGGSAAQNPPPNCFGVKPTIVGTNGPDNLKGTAGPDVMVGEGGNDTLDGGGGNDLICGNDGADTLHGGTGNDQIDGGNENDVVTGDAGNDTIDGGNGGDVINGGDGNDTVDGGGGDNFDVLSGGPGNDTIIGKRATDATADEVDYRQSAGAVQVDLQNGSATGEGSDTLRGIDWAVGSQFGDALVGNDGSNVLDGAGGNDRIDGGPGGDLLSGGAGDDTITGGSGAGTGVLEQDYAVYTSAPGPVQVDLGTGRATGLGNDTLSGIEGVFGSQSGDVLVGSGQGSLLWGQGGDDELRGQGGNDVALFSKPVDADMTQGRAIGEGTDKLVGLGGLVGSSGNDKLTGDANANVLAGGTGGSDVISGAGGADVLVSGGPSTLLGGPGADELQGGGGSDTLDGGTGDDLLSGGGGDDTIDGGAGTADAVSYLFSTSAVRVDLQQGTATGEGTDKLAGIENAAGSSHDDELIGDAGANALSGNDGNDRISGGAGSDFLDGGIGSNVLSGGPGVDYCRQKVRGCEISGAPNLPGKAPLPPGISATPTLAFSRAREPAPAVAYPVPEFALALAAEHLRPLMTARANRGETAAFEYAAEPICFAAKKPYSTEIAPPRTVSPIASDRKPEEAWWQGTLYRATGARYKKFKTTPWARADLAGGATVPGVTLWKDETGKRAFPSAVLLNVKRGRYVWKGNIYWVRSHGQVFQPVEPHIIRKQTITHNKQCIFP